MAVSLPPHTPSCLGLAVYKHPFIIQNLNDLVFQLTDSTLTVLMSPFLLQHVVAGVCKLQTEVYHISSVNLTTSA